MLFTVQASQARAGNLHHFFILYKFLNPCSNSCLASDGQLIHASPSETSMAVKALMAVRSLKVQQSMQHDAEAVTVIVHAYVMIYCVLHKYKSL